MLFRSVVLKCSEHVVWSTTWFVQAIRECLKACGHDEELVQLVCCYPEDAEALTKSPFIRHITFIGSERVGRTVSLLATAAYTRLTKRSRSRKQLRSTSPLLHWSLEARILPLSSRLPTWRNTSAC